MVFTLAGTSIEESDVQPLNVKSPIDVRHSGSAMTLRLLQPENAELPIDSLAELVENVIAVSCFASENALSPTV